MKKAYYVYSIFEKLNLTAGVKALAVMLVFSVSFFGVSSDATAQSEITPGFANVDQSFLKGFEFNEDKDYASTIIKEQMVLLDGVTPADGVEEVVHSSRSHFLHALAYNVSKGDVSIMASVSSAHVSLKHYVTRFVDAMQPHIDVEGIVTDYAKLLQ